MSESAQILKPAESSRRRSVLSTLLVRARKFTIENNLLLHFYCLFIVSFYFVPHARIFKSLFYYGVFLAFLLSINRETLEFLKRSLILRLAMLWLGYLSLTLMWSDGVTIKDFEAVVRGFVWVNVFLAVTIVLSRHEQAFPKQLFLSLAIVSALTAIIAILYFYRTHEFPNARLVGIGQLDRHAVASAMFYGAALLTTAFGLLDRSQAGPQKLLYAAVLAVLSVALALTASRGPILGVALAVLVGLLATRRWRLALAIASFGLAAVLYGVVADIGDYNLIARGSTFRLEIWANVADRIRDAYWFGHGIATDLPSLVLSNGRPFNKEAHQMFLANHYYGGVPATVFLFVLLAAAARTGYRRFRADGNFVYAAMLIFMIVVCMTYVNSVIKSPNLVWFYVWLPLGLIAGQEARMNERESVQRP